MPSCRLKPACLNIPSVMPLTAGPTAAPAMAVATCESATGQKDCQIRMMAEAAIEKKPGITTNQRLCRLLSTQAPAGAVMITPAIDPMVITDPIQPLCQPCAKRKTPMNGPMPDCMSAMKKFSDLSA